MYKIRGGETQIYGSKDPYIFICVHTYTYSRSIALDWDVHAMPRACSSAEILHGVPKRYKASSAANCKIVLTNSNIPVLFYVCLDRVLVPFMRSYISLSQ